MSYNILIIDDDQNLAEALSEILSCAGHQTTFANSGVAGLGKIRNTIPDVIVCDWEMPNLNGGELLREVRSFEATAHIPFITITGHTIVDTDFRPTAILTKPVFIFTLAETIKEAMQNIN